MRKYEKIERVYMRKLREKKYKNIEKVGRVRDCKPMKNESEKMSKCLNCF